MRSWGARASSCALMVLLAPLSLTLASCSEELDQAQSVQTRIGRIDDVVVSDVTKVSADRAGAIGIDYRAGLSPAQVVALAGEVADAADSQDYGDYRLTLREAGDPGHELVVDDTFAQEPGATTVVEHWRRLSSALIGDVTYDAEPGTARIAVASDAGFVHDVDEASRVGVRTPRTTWTFTADDSVYVDDGALRPQDVQLAERVQRTVTSPSLPVGAPGWRLETREDHVLLDLTPALPPTAPAALTIGAFGTELEVLVDASVDALDVTRRPLWLRLRHVGSEGEDVFGWWRSDRPPVPGRDPLVRGWDRWLQVVADDALAGDPS